MVLDNSCEDSETPEKRYMNAAPYVPGLIESLRQ